MAMSFLLTSRGIPQLFYGTEILMSNPGTESHGVIRSDFPVAGLVMMRTPLLVKDYRKATGCTGLSKAIAQLA